jgi:uncharacterized protein YecE (DUF72 family)
LPAEVALSSLEAAMVELHPKVGCCGFPTSRARYYSLFPVVEVQQTFYEPPRPETARRWREQAPAGFEFALKAWQLVTHEGTSPTYRRLKTSLSPRERSEAGSFRPTPIVFRAWDRTLEIATILEARKIVFQCPASFEPTEENRDRMRRFFRSIERKGIVCIWEPRGAWQPREIRALSEELDLVHCVDPFRAEPVTTGLRYFRLHGIGGYRYRYTDRDLDSLAARLPPGTETWVLFNNASMFEDARRFLARLA